MGKKLKFSIFWPTLYKPLARFLWFHAKMCGGLYPTYVTGLDDAQENRYARRPVVIRKIGKTGIASLTFWPTL